MTNKNRRDEYQRSICQTMHCEINKSAMMMIDEETQITYKTNI
jgi:hypothetical protein